MIQCLQFAFGGHPAAVALGLTIEPAILTSSYSFSSLDIVIHVTCDLRSSSTTTSPTAS